MTKRILFSLFLLFAMTGAVMADPVTADAEKTLSVKTFQLKHKDAEKAAAMIKSMMSADGSVTIQAGTRTLVITDRAENLKNIATAITKYDAPPQPVQLVIRLIGMSRVEGTPRVADELKDVVSKLAVLVRYNSFENIGVANVEGREGEQGVVDIGNGYRAEFRFGEYDPASDTVRLADFKLSRVQNEQMTQLMKTSLNLKPGDMTMLGASRDPQSARALMIVFSAKR